MKRISNSLFEAIRTVTSGPVIAESKEQIQEKGPNDGNLANNAKPYDKVTRRDVIHGALGKDEMGGKKKVKEEQDKDDVSLSEEEKVEEAKAPAATKSAKDNSPFNWKGTPRETKDKGELTGHSAKKISTGTVYTKKAVKEEKMPMAKSMRKKAMQESIAQTVVKYNDFTLEVTDNPTYSDYLKALQVMIPTNEETAQQEIINLASEAYQGQVQSIIIESMTRQKFSTILDEQRASGAKILDENYIVDSGESYVEYVVEKDGTRTQYIHCGNIIKS